MAEAKRKSTPRKAAAQSPMAAAKSAGPTSDPFTAPDRYIMMLDGDCMQPMISNGAAVMVEKNGQCAAGDIVVIFFKPEHVRPGHSNASLKRLVLNIAPWVKWPYREHPESDVRAVVVFEQINPPREYTVPATHIMAIHKVMGQVPLEAEFDPVSKSYRIPEGMALV